jgi:uncharacterized membrane protein YbhN (UPF0104 family)
MTRQFVTRGLRIVGTLAVLGVLVARLDTRELAASLSEVDPLLIAAGIGLVLARNAVQSWRWQLTLRGWGERVSLPVLLRMVLVGNLFTLLLPSTTGGDLARWSQLARRGCARSVAAQSVAADRLIGLAALGLLLAGVLVGGAGALPVEVARVALAVVLPGSLAMLAAVLEPRWLPARWRTRLGIAQARRHRWLLGALTVGLANHIVAGGVLVCLGRAVGDTTPVTIYASLLPVIWIVSMVPVSLGGLGVREAGFVALFATAGMPEATAGAIASLWLGLTLLQAGIGGLILLQGRRGAGGSSGRPAGDGHERSAETVVPALARQPGLAASEAVEEPVEMSR